VFTGRMAAVVVTPLLEVQKQGSNVACTGCSVVHSDTECTGNKSVIAMCTEWIVGRDSSVGIVTRYGLDGPGIESQWGEIFTPIQTGPVAHPASYTMGTGSFPGVKRLGHGVDHPPSSSAKVKEKCSYTSTPPLGLHGLF
jgi:hypothetical protein